MEYIFEKYQGTGNDFILFDARLRNFKMLKQSQIRSICNRNFGIGADGIIIIKDHDVFDFEMLYYNSDGLLSSMCGNGARCAVAYAYEKKIFSKETSFNAYDGAHKAYVQSNSIVKLDFKDVLKIEENKNGLLIDTGSPHLIIFNNNLEKLNIKKLGSTIRYSNEFIKDGINVNFVQCIDKNIIKLRTYERGVENETLACGTGAVASAIAAHYKRKVKNFSKILVETLGGDLLVNFTYKSKIYNNIYLSGKTEKIFSGKIFL